MTYAGSNFTDVLFALNPSTYSTIYLSVTSCTSAHLLLSADVTDTSSRAFEIVLGIRVPGEQLKQWFSIRDYRTDTELIGSLKTGFLLDCEQEQSYKIQYSDGYILVEPDTKQGHWLLRTPGPVVQADLKTMGLASKEGNASWSLYQYEGIIHIDIIVRF